MRKFFFLFPIALLLAGCASSERAFRMSGGVLDTYSAPKSFRLRSEKFRKMDKMSIPARANKDQLSGINETLVNIWPFYFRSNNYFSVLWPMIDWDPYGMAIRPFYNQEGDDYSILFPLSSWNPADKSGWVANFRWKKNGFGFIPLTWQERTETALNCYYTPFFIMNRDYSKLGFDYKRNYLRQYSSDFTEFLLGYYGVERRLSLDGWSSLFYRDALNNELLKYRVWKSGRPAMKTQADLTALRKEIEKRFVQYETTYGGFFPIFHLNRTPSTNSYNWNIAGFLANVNKRPQYTDVVIGGKWITSYKYREYDNFHAVLHREKSFEELVILPLLSGTEEATYLKTTPEITALRELHNAVYGGNFAQQLPKVNELLQKLSPGTKVPEFINTTYLLHLYIEDFIKDHCKKLKFEFYTQGKFRSPLYANEWGYAQNSWFIFPLLTGGKSGKDGSWKWFSLPLLSGAGHNSVEDYTLILPPLLYHSKTLRFDTPGRYVHDSEAKWPRDDNANIESTDIYAGCGLFYRGRVKFLVAKPGMSNRTINDLSALFNHLPRLKNSLDRSEKNYARKLYLANAVKPRTKIEEYEKLIELEKLKLRRAAIDKEWKSFKGKIAQAEALAKKLGFTFSVSDWGNRDQRDEAERKLYAHATLVREKSDIGNGLFFRREDYYNGDWKWRLFLNIAGSEKNGSKESSHILHFLYRKQVDGDREEMLIFPFISIQKDGKNSKFSFLGRIYQKSVIDGKSSGYIFFIPF